MSGVAGVRIEAEGGAGVAGEPAGVLLHVKAVPGAKRDGIVGALGERLKVRVSAPPEGGRANGAICSLLAERLGLSARDVEVVRGATSAEKVVRVRGLTVEGVRARLGEG